jgi:hypothetical protein
MEWEEIYCLISWWQSRVHWIQEIWMHQDCLTLKQEAHATTWNRKYGTCRAVRCSSKIESVGNSYSKFCGQTAFAFKMAFVLECVIGWHKICFRKLLRKWRYWAESFSKLVKSGTVVVQDVIYMAGSWHHWTMFNEVEVNLQTFIGTITQLHLHRYVSNLGPPFIDQWVLQVLL